MATFVSVVSLSSSWQHLSLWYHYHHHGNICLCGIIIIIIMATFVYVVSLSSSLCGILSSLLHYCLCGNFIVIMVTFIYVILLSSLWQHLVPCYHYHGNILLSSSWQHLFLWYHKQHHGNICHCGIIITIMATFVSVVLLSSFVTVT